MCVHACACVCGCDVMVSVRCTCASEGRGGKIAVSSTECCSKANSISTALITRI